MRVHPFYGSSSQWLGGMEYWWIGLASMALYLVFWGVVIVIAIRLFKKSSFFSTGNRSHPEDTALQILRERYARGEIDSEEFKQKKADLM
jgi:putative membrane protein